MREDKGIFLKIANSIRHYDHNKYWKMRNYVVRSGGIKIIKLLYLFRIKRMDAYNCASFGTHFGYGAKFASSPLLPHGIRGIFISHNAQIGKNVVIFHQVTIGEGKGGAPVIGDNVLIGPGAKIVGKVKVGDNVKIGANVVVVQDIPSNSTVVMNKPRVIVRN